MSISPQTASQSVAAAMSGSSQPIKIVTSGQAGVERAALDAAMDAGLPVGGCCPLGRAAEDGPISNRYPLKEATTSNDLEPTLYNLQQSNGLIVVSKGPLLGTVIFTYQFILDERKPVIIVDFARSTIPTIEEMLQWMEKHGVKTIHVCGLTETISPGIYQRTYDYLKPLFQKLQSAD